MSEVARLLRRLGAATRQRVVAAYRDRAAAGRAVLAWAWARRPPAARASALGFIAVTTALSAWAILAQARLPALLPSALDWAAARALVERDARAGDAVALSPAWAERAREVLPPSVAVLAQRRYAGEDLVGVRRVWLLSIPAAPRFSPQAELDLVARASRSGPVERLGAIDMTRREIEFPTLPLAFLPDRLPRASVKLGAADCPPDGAGRFECPGEAAVVDRAVREVSGVPRACLVLSAPAPLASPVRVAFPLARIGRTLHGHAGLVSAGAERVPGAPLRIALEIDGDEVGAAEVSLTGFSRYDIDMTRLAGPSRALTLVMSSAAALGTVCVDAEILP